MAARLRFCGGLAAAASVLIVPTGTAGGGALSSGLQGVVMRGPVTPVCMVGVPCSRPAAGLVLAFRRGGNNRANVTTAKNGTYRVRLAAGTYGVRVTHPSTTRPIKPASVTVDAGRIKRVNFYIDTGIR
jgi:hypothetical protein